MKHECSLGHCKSCFLVLLQDSWWLPSSANLTAPDLRISEPIQTGPRAIAFVSCLIQTLSYNTAFQHQQRNVCSPLPPDSPPWLIPNLRESSVGGLEMRFHNSQGIICWIWLGGMVRSCFLVWASLTYLPCKQSEKITCKEIQFHLWLLKLC